MASTVTAEGCLGIREGRVTDGAASRMSVKPMSLGIDYAILDELIRKHVGELRQRRARRHTRRVAVATAPRLAKM
uniref:Uncharacterized protein n=1 Tax=Oryza glumipatula TaxID=40148 RepID=A0A0E0AH20_9ORYZ